MKLLLGLGVMFVVTGSYADLAHAESPAVAAPCDKAPSLEAVQAAKNAFHEGEKAFQEAAYSRAIELWSAAYSKDCTAHALLLNLATAHELHHHPRQAIHALRLFNRRKPQSPYVEPNFKRIIRLEDQITKSIQEQEATEKLRLQITATNDSAPGAGPIVSPSGPKVLPIALMGGGVLTALAGLGIYLEASGTEKKAQEACNGDRSRCEDFEAVLLGDSARQRVNLGGLLAAGGTAVAGLGLLWHWLGSDDSASAEDSSSARASPLQWAAATTDHSIGLQLNGQF